LAPELVDLIAALSAASERLGNRLHPKSAASLADLVRVMNCYYSNLIEGHNTRPRDIELALENRFDQDGERRNLQMEAAAHIRVQREIDARYAAGTLQDAASQRFICWLHEEFYKELPESMRLYFSADEKLSNNVHHVHYVHHSENDADGQRAEIERSVSVVERVIAKAKDNAGLYAGSEFIHAMKFIREKSDEEWVRLRVKIKNEKPSGVLLSALDDATRPEGEAIGSEKNTAAELIALVKSRCDLFYDDTTRSCFVTVSADNSTLRVGSTAFLEWLSYAYYSQRASSASDAAVKQAISTVSGICREQRHTLKGW